MSANSSLREVLNGGNPNLVFDAMVRGHLGDMLGYACSKMGYTETGIAVTSNVSTLAAVPKALFNCVVATVSGGSGTGVKKLRQGPISGPSALVPAAGECVWDGGLHVLFATADLALTASFTYAVATDIASLTEADIVNT
jgi:hypothetical protein